MNMNGKYYQRFPYTTPRTLFRKSLSLDTDFLNSAPGLYTENSGTHYTQIIEVFYKSARKFAWICHVISYTYLFFCESLFLHTLFQLLVSANKKYTYSSKYHHTGDTQILSIIHAQTYVPEASIAIFQVILKVYGTFHSHHSC